MCKYWSPVSNPSEKPLRWWYHKVLCEWYYARKNDGMYYHHLNKLCDMGWNLYGQKFNIKRQR